MSTVRHIYYQHNMSGRIVFISDHFTVILDMLFIIISCDKNDYATS